MIDRTWVAHCIYPAGEVARLGAAGVGVAHCPSSNMMIGGGGWLRWPSYGPLVRRSAWAATAPRPPTRVAVDRGARRAAPGPAAPGPAAMGARDALEIATRGSAGCLGREGELGPRRRRRRGPGVLAAEGIAFAGALTDPVEAWLRCGPVVARHTVVAGGPWCETANSSPRGSTKSCAGTAPPPPGFRGWNSGDGGWAYPPG